MLRLQSTVLLLLVGYASLSAAEYCDPVVNGGGFLDGRAYENSPNGFIVLTAALSGNESNIELSLSGGLEQYFEVSGITLVVKNSEKLSRDEPSLSPGDENYVDFDGQVLCNGNDSSANTFFTVVRMFYTNQFDPVITSSNEIEQSEYTTIGTKVHIFEGNDGDDTGYIPSYTISMQDPADYFEIQNNGELVLAKNLDYEENIEHYLAIDAFDQGFDELGNSVSRNTSQILTITISNYDDIPPIFNNNSTVYSASFYTDETGEITNVMPEPIEAIDGDGLGATINYKIPESEEMFKIDSQTGIVSVITEITDEGTYTVPVTAYQVDRPSMSSTTFLQVYVIQVDDNKPDISSPAVSGDGISDASVTDDGSEIIFVKDSGGNVIQLSVSDIDDDDASIIYTIQPQGVFQVDTGGYIFGRRDVIFSDAAVLSEFTIKAINLDASIYSNNRESNPIYLYVAVEETNVVEIVPKDTLVGVAAGLSSALFVAILAIIYLVWKLNKKNKKDPEDNKSEKASVTHSAHSNEAYSEVDERQERRNSVDLAQQNGVDVEYAAIDVEGVGDADSHAYDGDEVKDPESSHFKESFKDFEFSEIQNYETAPETTRQRPESEASDYEKLIIVPDQEEPVVEEASSLDAAPLSSFESELLKRANEISAAAAASASIAREAEQPSAPKVAAQFKEDLPPEVVKVDGVIKESALRSVKIVTLEGYGDDAADVKAVLKTIDTDMASTTDVNNVKKRLAILADISEMDHPNILKYYGCYETDGTINYALRFAENGNLKDKLASCSFDSNNMMHIMAQIANGLQYLHAKNITHGHIWAKSVMLDSTNIPMLTDIEGGGETLSENEEIMRWQAIEVVKRTSGCTTVTDVWSYGMLMWEIVSQGGTPYGDVPLHDLEKVMDQDTLQKPQGCSESLFEVMERCWKKDPKFRPDMYEINGILGEKLLEDSNELICLEPINQASLQDVENTDGITQEQQSASKSDSEYTAF